MFTVVVQTLYTVVLFLQVSCIFITGQILIRLSCARKVITKIIHKTADVPLPDELYWGSLFSWPMIKSLWQQGILDIGKTASKGKPPPNPLLVDPATGNGVALLDILSLQKLHVLAFGSLSCPVFRMKFKDLKSIAQEFHEFAEFSIIYIDEAHPADGWAFKDDLPIFKHRTIEDRLKAVQKFRIFDEQMSIPVYADSMKNEASKMFGVTYIRLYIIQNGVVIYQGGVGPKYYSLEEVTNVIANVCISNAYK